MEFTEVAEDVWSKLEEPRNATSGSPFIKWVLLKERESMEGNICGIIFYKRGLIRNKEYAEIVLSNDTGTDDNYQNQGFTIHSWRSKHMPVNIFTTGDSTDYRQNLESAVNKFKEVIASLADAANNRSLEKNFPSDWVGDSAGKYFHENIIKPKEEKIRLILLFAMIGGPILLLTGAVLPALYVFALVNTLFWGSGIAMYWLGLNNELSEKWKTPTIIISFLFIILSWSIVTLVLVQGWA